MKRGWGKAAPVARGRYESLHITVVQTKKCSIKRLLVYDLDVFAVGKHNERFEQKLLNYSKLEKY